VDEEYWFGFFYCKEDEKQLAKLKRQGLCHYVGEYCSKKLNLLFAKFCIEHKKTYCCFNSKLARIVHEQGRPQLKGFDWGAPDGPNCRGFEPEEFQMLDFSRIDLSEWYGDIEVRAQEQIKNSMQQSVEGFYNKIDK
jgi:conjugal transfer mating pair stabilization protein TraN